MMTRRDVEEDIEPGLKYTEDTGRTDLSLPVRDCSLWHVGVDEPISGLNVVSFRQRFGAVAVPAEGIGGVETRPLFRRRGYVRKLLTQAIAGITTRVPVVFVSDGIEDLYEKFGFVTCLAEADLSVPIRTVERLAGTSALPSSQLMRSFAHDDLPAMVRLYNLAHTHRPWTHERHAQWNQLLIPQTWQPGSETIILERDGVVAGYAILTETRYGRGAPPVVVDELTARDTAAAEALLVEVAARCWHLRLSDFRVREPLDSAVGRAAQRLGCTYQQTFPASGGMMGAILDRQQLLRMLEPELRRRLPTDELHPVHTAAFDALCRSELVSDNRVLLRLLVGYWSATDACALGTMIPAQYQRVCEAWFPGGGSAYLPQPYAHRLDRY
jgi:ribosomal protein S18 acetylase RimI-like enzyme